jgi:hypothetical protein
MTVAIRVVMPGRRGAGSGPVTDQAKRQQVRVQQLVHQFRVGAQRVQRVGYGRYGPRRRRGFGGGTSPSVIRAGWWWGTDRHDAGEFFRAEITQALFR